MSNETKRDVFELALNHAAKTGWVDYGQLSDRYAAALPDDMPVIPMKIDNFIKQSVYEDATLQEALECAHDEQFRVGRWVSAHSEIFARAWVLGVWRVEGTGEIVKMEVKD